MHETTRTTRRRLVALTLAAATWIPASQADAARVGDLVRLKGTRVNRLTGLGLVVGLDGTGDGDSSAQAMRALAQWMNKFSAPVTSGDVLDLKNIAIVTLTVTLPQHGVREGDQVDVEVAAIGGAKSIVGGQLMQSPLLGPRGDRLFAFAAGAVIGDNDAPNVGRIREGAVMEADVIHSYIATGGDLIEVYGRAGKRLELAGLQTWVQPERHYITLLISENQASYPLAYHIANVIDQDRGDHFDDPGDTGQQRPIARAMSPREIMVEIPAAEQNNAASFIGDVQAVDLNMGMQNAEARVVLNRKRGTIVVTGEVQISPSGIAVRGMTITTAGPTAENDAEAVPVDTRSFVALDQNLEKEAGASLTNLLDALNQLKVDTNRQMDVIEELNRAGQLHAKLIVVEE